MQPSELHTVVFPTAFDSPPSVAILPNEPAVPSLLVAGAPSAIQPSVLHAAVLLDRDLSAFVPHYATVHHVVVLHVAALLQHTAPVIP